MIKKKLKISYLRLEFFFSRVFPQIDQYMLTFHETANSCVLN